MLDLARPLSRRDAARALYIDFEGFKDCTPALLGVLSDECLEQVVLDGQLASAARASRLRVSSLQAEIERLILRCRREDRVLVGFTTHEVTVCRRFAELDIGPVYRDAHKIARRWVNSRHRGEYTGDRSLHSFLSFIGMRPPRYLGRQQSTNRLRYVLEKLSKHGSYAGLTRTAKGKWTKFLRHNEHDCRGTYALISRITEEVA